MPLYFVSFRAILSPALVFFSSCLGSGIGRLALRCPPSACGRLFATFRPLSLCHVSRGHKRQRPARNVLNAGIAPAACEGLLPAVLFLFCLLVGDVIPAFVLFPQFYSGFVHFAMEKCLDLALRTEGAAGSVAPTQTPFGAFLCISVAFLRPFFIFICVYHFFVVPLHPQTRAGVSA